MASVNVSARAPLSAAKAPELLDYALLAFLAAVWGATFMVIKVGVETMSSWTMTAVRLTVAMVFMLGVVAWNREAFPRSRSFWWLAAVTALIGNMLPFVLISWGEERIDSGVAAICLATMPLLTVLFAHVSLPDDKMTPGKLIGVLFGLAGLIILVGPGKIASFGTETVRQFAVIAAAVCYALNAVITRKLLRDHPRYALTAAVMTLAAVMIVPLALIVDGLPTLTGASAPSLRSLAAAVTLGVLQTAICQIVLFFVLARQGATFFSQVNFFVPAFGVLWGVLLMGETLPPQAFAALTVILCGVAIVRMWGTGLPAATSSASRMNVHTFSASRPVQSRAHSRAQSKAKAQTKRRQARQQRLRQR